MKRCRRLGEGSGLGYYGRGANPQVLAKRAEMENVRMGTNELYRTSDIYVTSWLLPNGLQLEGIVR